MDDRNVTYKRSRPFLTFLVVLLVLALLGVIFGFVWKLSSGFKDWSWFDVKDEEFDEIEDESASTYSLTEPLSFDFYIYGD